MKRLTRFVVVITSVLVCSVGQAQHAAGQGKQVQADIEKFTQELLVNIAAANGKKDAAVKVLISTQQQAEQDSNRIASAKVKATDEFAAATKYQAIAKSRIRTHGGAQSIDTDAYKDYEDSVQRTSAAQASVTMLKTQEEVAKKNLDTANRELESARIERDAWVAASDSQRAELAKLYKAWGENNTEANFKALTGQLTAMAATVGETSDVDLVTKKGNQLNPGALIKYESELDRKNKVQPIKSANCSTGCTETGMPKGWYYMWSERGQGETSDKNRYVHIKGPKDKVEILENP